MRTTLAILIVAWGALPALHAQAPVTHSPATIISSGGTGMSSGGTGATSAPPPAWSADRSSVSGTLRPNSTPAYPDLPLDARTAGVPVVTAAAQEPASNLPQFNSTQTAYGTVSTNDTRVSATAQDPDGFKHIPLAPPSDRFKGEAPKASGGTLQTVVSVGSSLLLVVGLFLGVAWCYRKTLSSTAGGGLPKQVVNVLGRTSISTRQQMVLVRFGSKLLLVSVIQGEARTLGEITDPLEVDQLVGLCESGQPGSITNSFKSVLLQEGGR